MRILHILTLSIGGIGAAVITWGVIVSVREFVALELAGRDPETRCRKREYLRHHLGSYLLLGLEFMVAADIINTVTQPSLTEIAVLGGIVAIRTVLNVSLNRELQSHDRVEDEGRRA